MKFGFEVTGQPIKKSFILTKFFSSPAIILGSKVNFESDVV